MRAGVDANARVDVLAAGEDGLLETKSMGIFLVLKFVPDLSGQELAEQ